ncbi:MAG: hypothetical protein SPI74_00545 [Eubacterium sp.]|nr:hypothetical protein [Eubacterium sp.]
MLFLILKRSADKVRKKWFNMSNVNKYKFTVEKHARKWSQIIVHYNSGKDGKAKVLKETVADIPAGETVIRDGKLNVQRNAYGTTVELIILSSEEVINEKAAEKEAFINRWWGYFLDSYKEGRFYERAVKELHKIDFHDKDEEIQEMKRTLFVNKWWGYFLNNYNEGRFYNRAVEELHKIDFHDKDKEIEKCREEIENIRLKRESQYKKFAFAAANGFYGKPSKGELFVENNTPYEVISSYYHKDDGWSFGVMSEEWYSVKAKDISDTEYGRKYLEKYLENRKWNELKSSAMTQKNIAYKSLVNEIMNNGERYAGENISLNKIKGNDIINTVDIYGGGYIIRVSDDKVWYIVENGMDGDDWSLNNISTGGAGAYGFFAEYDKVKGKIEDYIKSKEEYENIINNIEKNAEEQKKDEFEL